MVAAAAARQGAAVLVRERDAGSPSFAPLLATVLAPSAPAAAAAEYRGWVVRAGTSAWIAHARAKVESLAKQKAIVQAPPKGAAAPAKGALSLPASRKVSPSTSPTKPR